MSDTEKKIHKTMMLLNMDFRMTTLIHFLVFCLCMSNILFYFLFIYFFFGKTVQMVSYKFKHIPSLTLAVFFSVS